MRVLISVLFVFLLAAFTIGQDQVFDQFSGLKSGGQIPADFLKTSTEKYKTDYTTNENEALDKDFFRSTRFVIDELLKSGKILFNEPLSVYLNKVADYALSNHSELLNELKFYVLKSTEVNAFSTDQGIIFFTTGLMAQLENEAQLAYILLHEVSHYTKKHVQNSYVERKEMLRGKNRYSRLGYDDRVNEMSIYSKNNELEADSEGIDMYLETEYAVDEIVSSFGVLLYSYLPFEDLSFDSLFFDTEYLKVPGFFFPDTINPITKEEDYDDSRSTHPNIKTRIDNSFDIIDDRESKGTLQFKISEADFTMVRNLARFEGVRLKLTQRLYVDAIYDIFLLRKDFSNNQFLDESLVKALYGLSKYKFAGRFSEVRTRLSKVEGESYRLHAMIQKLSSAQLSVLSYRYAYDLQKKYPNNKLYEKYESQLKKELALNDKIDIKKFSSGTFSDFKDSVEVLVEQFDIEDSIKKIEASDLSKYQKIKRKKALNSIGKLSDGSENPSDANFHYYALGDLVLNKDFIEDLKSIKKEEDETNLETNLVSLNKNESINIGLDSVVIVDPYFSAYKVSGDEDFEKSEKFQDYLANIYMDDYSRLDLHRDIISTKSMVKSEVDKYNQLGDIYLYLSEMLDHDELNFISSSHEEIKRIASEYGTSSFLFSKIDVSKERKDLNIAHVYGVLLVATIPLVLYDLRARPSIDYKVLLIDTDSDELIYGDNITINQQGNKRNIDFLVFHVLNNINSKEK